MKKNNFFKFVLMAMIVLQLSGAYCFAGSEGVGGGDPCQNRIEEIRNNIDDWIQASALSTADLRVGSAQLDFSQTRTDLDTYNQKMSKLIALTRLDAQTSISCTSNPQKVKVRGVEKLCVARLKSNRPKILCYRGKTQGDGKYVDGFLGASEEQQYFQVHHEFAVMAKFEDLNGDETNYPLSPQVSAKLEAQVVKKLPILPKTKDVDQGSWYEIVPEFTRARGEFRRARVPSLEDLRLGLAWDCVIYPGIFWATVPQSALEIANALRFSRGDFKRLVTPSHLGMSAFAFASNGELEGVLVDYSPGRIELNGNMKYKSSIRVTSQGDLIYELSYNRDVPRYSAIAHPDYAAVFYAKCAL